MTFIEQTTDPERFVLWHGDMEADYLYTLGVAGERFFRHLRDKGEFLAAHCPACDQRFLPPRIYCPSCAASLDAFEPVEGSAEVREVTTARLGLDGAPLHEPVTYAIVGYPGIRGGLLHRLIDVPPGGARPGLRVEPVLAPRGKRLGLVTDILGFRPCEG